MNKYNKKKADQLGISYGAASNKLRKMVLFQLLTELNRLSCFQCSLIIQTIDELSIEHKRPWLDSEDPINAFFDLDNIAFSHMSCNSGAARKTNKKYFTNESRIEASRKIQRDLNRKHYTTEKRRKRYTETGH